MTIEQERETYAKIVAQVRKELSGKPHTGDEFIAAVQERFEKAKEKSAGK